MNTCFNTHFQDTSGLNTFEVGVYTLLMMAIWKNNGTIAGSDLDVLKIIKTSIEQWLDCKGRMMMIFSETNGSIHHYALDDYFKKKQVLSVKRSNAGLAGVERRKQLRMANEQLKNENQSQLFDSEKTTQIDLKVVAVVPKAQPQSPEYMMDANGDYMGMSQEQTLAKQDGKKADSAQSDSAIEQDGLGLTPGLVCKHMKAQGIAMVSGSSIKLIEMLQNGLTLQTIDEAIAVAIQKGNRHFSYVLGVAGNFMKQDALATRDNIAPPQGFDQFWQAYPKKADRQRAINEYRLANAGAYIEKILQNIQQRMAFKQWENEQFIPSPANYLRDKRWEDEVKPNLDISKMILGKANLSTDVLIKNGIGFTKEKSEQCKLENQKRMAAYMERRLAEKNQSQRCLAAA